MIYHYMFLLPKGRLLDHGDLRVRRLHLHPRVVHTIYIYIYIHIVKHHCLSLSLYIYIYICLFVVKLCNLLYFSSGAPSTSATGSLESSQHIAVYRFSVEMKRIHENR